MPIPKYFIFNDESVTNSHGFRILNSGGNFERFNDNPVMLDTHDQKAVIGCWKNLRVDGSNLIADPVFDTDDPDAAKVAGKVERGFVKAASIGIYIEEANYMTLPDGTLDLVVTKWELLEGSVLGIPSNRNALAFFSKEGVQLSAAEVLQTVQTLAAPTMPPGEITPDTNTDLSNMDKKPIILSAEAATALGIAVEHEDGTAISAAIVALAAKYTKAETDLKTFKTERATSLVDLAVTEGRIDATRKESFVKMAVSDFQQAKDVLDAMPAKKELGANVRTGTKGIPGDRSDWNYMKWAKEDPEGLAQLQVNDQEAFNTLRLGYKSKFSSEA
jgi:HK97 family phage prohead protease